MAQHIDGPLYFERMGQTGPVMAFIHPNPFDQSCWIYQMAHLSTWYRCIAIDLPGYGRSPKAVAGLTMSDLAQACWEAIDQVTDGLAILVGSSTGSRVIPFMYRLRPTQTAAVILSATGAQSPEAFAPARIAAFRQRGVAYRWDYTFEDFSPAFRGTPLALYFANLFDERNARVDVDSIIRQFEALQGPSPADLFELRCPTLVLSGTEDAAHHSAFALKDRIPGAEIGILPGAGHACHMEQPWLFDEHVLSFLRRKRMLTRAEPT